VKSEAAGDAMCIRIEPFHQAVRQSLVHAAAASLRASAGSVKIPPA
jgi:hypothetical protein